jgi:hypothetical protein
MSFGSPVLSSAARDRLLPFVVVGLVSVAAADSIAGMGTRIPKPLILVLALAGAAVLLSVDTTQLFLGWLFVAPLRRSSYS